MKANGSPVWTSAVSNAKLPLMCIPSGLTHPPSMRRFTPLASASSIVSGASEHTDRPGLMAALEDIPVHRAGVLLIARRDRIARDVVVAATNDGPGVRGGLPTG